MNTLNVIFKKSFLFVILFLSFSSIQSQPTVFTWNDRHGFDYISSAKDQKEQGPCGIFATVAAVEAMVQIYFNTTGSELNLSEGNLYSECGIQEFPAPQALAFFVSNGVIDDAHWPFPTEYVNNPPWRYYLPYPDCGEYFIVNPNPTNSFVDVDVIKEKLPSLDYISNEECTITTIDKSGIIKSKVNFKGFPYRLNTDNLPDGLYFLNIHIKDIKSTILLSVKH